MALGDFRTTRIDNAGVQWAAPRLEQFCAYATEKIMFALSDVLVAEGVEPEKRREIKESMLVQLMKIGEMLIVKALEQKMLDADTLRVSMLKEKSRSIIYAGEED